MPVRLLQSLSVAERSISFQDRRFLAIGTSREDDLCNDVSQDGVIVCHSSSTLYMMSHITFLQALHHNLCNRRERKRNRLFTRPIFFPCGEKWSGNETMFVAGMGVVDEKILTGIVVLTKFVIASHDYEPTLDFLEGIQHRFQRPLPPPESPPILCISDGTTTCG